MGAAAVTLSADEMAALDAALSPEKVSGPRYDAKQMAHGRPLAGGSGDMEIKRSGSQPSGKGPAE